MTNTQAEKLFELHKSGHLVLFSGFVLGIWKEAGEIVCKSYGLSTKPLTNYDVNTIKVYTLVDWRI